MELIKRLGRKFNKTKTNENSWGLFLCLFCNNKVERYLSNGKIAKSCGCAREKNIGKALKRKKGKDNSNWKGGRSKHVSGYIHIYAPNHPFADCHRYVFEHRLVMEAKN